MQHAEPEHGYMQQHSFARWSLEVYTALMTLTGERGPLSPAVEEEIRGYYEDGDSPDEAAAELFSYYD